MAVAFSQPAASRDTTIHKNRSYQVKTVKPQVIRLERPGSKDSLRPAMRTRRDTILYLIEQHKRQMAQPQR
jgi:hypothetical protein